MKAKVIGCSDDAYWYGKDEIGKIYDVNPIPIKDMLNGDCIYILGEDYGFDPKDLEFLVKEDTDLEQLRKLFLVDPETGESLITSSPITQENGMNTFIVSRGINEEGTDWEVSYKVSFKIEEF